MKICCVFSFKSPHRGDSNAYKQYTVSNIKKEKHIKLSQIFSQGIFFKGPKNEFETAVVNEPSVFELLKFYCSFYESNSIIIGETIFIEPLNHKCNLKRCL